MTCPSEGSQIRQFMAERIERSDNTDIVISFLQSSPDHDVPEVLTWQHVPWAVLLPAYMLSELKSFQLFDVAFLFFVIPLGFIGLVLVASVTRGYDYRCIDSPQHSRIISAQRLVIVALALSIPHYLIISAGGGLLSEKFFAVIGGTVPVFFVECLRLITFLFTSVTIVFTLLALFYMLRALQVDTITTLFLLMGGLVPVIGLIFLIGVNFEAVKRLRSAGYQVDLFRSKCAAVQCQR